MISLVVRTAANIRPLPRGWPAPVRGSLVLASCQVPAHVAPVGGEQDVMARAAAGEARFTIRGRAIFPPDDRQTQATAAQVTRSATLTLAEAASGRTVAGGRTDGAGNFSLTPDASFSPGPDSFYYLKVTRRAGAALGSSLASMATVLRWRSGGWTSITNGTAGAGAIAINPTTTAVLLIQREDAGTALGQLIGTVSGPPGYATVAAFGGHTQAEVDTRAARVAELISQNADPVGNALTSTLGMLAPDDTGDPGQHHDYTVVKDGVRSVFVWVPVFTAYQLVNPEGSWHAGKPVGCWVKDKPASGTQGVDWAMERFGGFYAAKYEASRSDATPGNPTTGSGATAGTSTTLKVQQYCVPWTDIDWDAAAKACLAYDAHAHLVRSDEWTALAVWSMLEGITVFGNNDSRRDATDPGITFTADPTYSAGSKDRALTGSGTRSTWAGNTNLTTHTGTTAGVYDLNGNLWEWAGDLGAAASSGTYILDGVDTGVKLGEGYISALSTDPRLRRHGLPGAKGADTPLLGSDSYAIWNNQSYAAKARRGGNWGGTTAAGVWSLSLRYERTRAESSVGFRPALRF